MAVDSAYGPIISHWQVEQAVVNLIGNVPAGGVAPRIVFYLAELERLNGLVPQSLGQPTTVRGGTDFTHWKEDESPLIIVVVEARNPPLPLDTIGYGQVFEIQVAADVMAQNEDDARQQASMFGAAIHKLMIDNGSLGPSPLDPSVGLAASTTPLGFPIPAFAVTDTTSRNIMRAVATFESFIAPVVTQGSSIDFSQDPYRSPAPLPVVQETNVTFDVLAPS